MKKKMNQIEKEVLQKITPTKEYRKKLKKIIDQLEDDIKKEFKKRRLTVDLMLVGSIAKDTYLMTNMDIDFFVCYPTSFKKEKIAKNTLSIGKSLLKDTEESYAEHPYLRGYYKDFYVELVPCYKIEKASQKLSAVDRTPLHTEYVKEHLKENQKDDVRLLKQFLRGINCYGAESQIQGFSGYLCEILVIYYKSFKKLLENVKKWENGIKLALKKGKYPDFETPLVFIDPVDSDRNVASALSKEKFDLFIKASKEYLKKPSIKFFFPDPIKPWSYEKIKNEIQKQNCRYIGIVFNEPDILDENLFPQIRKAEKSIEKACKEKDFEIHDTQFFIDKKGKDIYIIIKTKKEKLSDTKIHHGPPLKLKENVEQFKQKWKNHRKLVEGPYEEDKRIKVEIKREYTDFKQFLEDNLLELSLGKHLDKVIKKKYKIFENNELIKEDLRAFWTDYLDNKYPWER